MTLSAAAVATAASAALPPPASISRPAATANGCEAATMPRRPSTGERRELKGRSDVIVSLDQYCRLGVRVVHAQDRTRFGCSAPQQDFYLRVAFGQVHTADHRGHPSLRQAACPDVDAATVCGRRAGQVAIVERVDKGGITGVLPSPVAGRSSLPSRPPGGRAPTRN